ncbi:MAG: hypothetical protein ABFS45_06480 [Pseudomonadota bacterium]
MPYSMGNFLIKGMMMRYSAFIPRFYNYCKSLGFEAGKIMPSRAFCSDESQGYPIILIAKHFGTFPFNHGRVGGVVATDRHGPQAHHGKDLAIIQASHVGYDPDTETFGLYRRLLVGDEAQTSSCGKICAVLDWYVRELNFARNRVFFTLVDHTPAIVIDNLLLDVKRDEGLFLSLEKLVEMVDGELAHPIHVYSIAKAYRLNLAFMEELSDSLWQDGKRIPIGDHLTAELFRFKRNTLRATEGHNHLEENLSHTLPHIITSAHPALAAAQANTQTEFDRTYRSIIKEAGYQGKNLAFISGLNIDISPRPGQLFPLTKFVPWAAYIQTEDGQQFTLEQDELLAKLHEQPTENPDQIDLEQAISIMEQAEEVSVKL